MQMITKPMLAGTAHFEDLDRIEWPGLASPKIDDISAEELVGLPQEIVAAGNIDLGQIISGNGSSPA